MIGGRGASHKNLMPVVAVSSHLFARYLLYSLAMPRRPTCFFSRRNSRSLTSGSAVLVRAAAATGQDDRTVECECNTVIVTVRNTYGTRVTVEARLEGSVEELKGAITEKCDVPVDQQRFLFYKGRLLVNDRRVGSYGIKTGDTILMVRGSVPTVTFSNPGIAPTTALVAADADSSDPAGYTNIHSRDPAGHPDMKNIQRAVCMYTMNYCIRAILNLTEWRRLPENLEETIGVPPIEHVSFSHGLMRSFFLSIPHVQDIIDRHPCTGRLVNNTGFLKKIFETSRNTGMMQRTLQATRISLRKVESSHVGFNILRKLYDDFGDPYMNEATMAKGNEDDCASEPLTAQSTPRDGINNPSNMRSESASRISTPNTEPLPNPWANFIARSGPLVLSRVPLGQTAHASGQSSDKDTVPADTSSLQGATGVPPNGSLKIKRRMRSRLPAPSQYWSSHYYRGVANNGNRNAFSHYAVLLCLPVTPEEVYATQLSQLQEMGFLDTQLNIRALQATSGNVQAAVEHLLRNAGR